MDAGRICRVMWARAVEESDVRGEVVALARREEASRLAAGELGGCAEVEGSGVLGSRGWAFLAARAERLAEGLARLGAPWMRLPVARFGGALLMGGAFATGFATHLAALDRRFDLLSGPVCFVLVWNAGVYVLALAMIGRRAFGAGQGALTGWIGSLLGRWMGRGVKAADGSIGACAARRYGEMLLPWARSWLGAVVAFWLHAASVCFAAGLLAGVYWRGLSAQYHACWESTWLGPEQTGAVLGGLLGPASKLTGIALPGDVTGWELLRHRPGFEGVPAGPWIHLYAVTLALWVGVPRVMLGAMAALCARRGMRMPPAWNAREPYLRRVFSSVRGGGGAVAVAVLPFDFKQPRTMDDGRFRDAIGRLVREAWGGGARVVWAPGAAYGDESALWEGPWRAAGDCGAAVVLFDGTATPEAEVHGAALGAVTGRFEGGGVLAAVECARLGAERVPGRMAAWRAAAEPHGLIPLALSDGEAAEDPASFVRRG